MTIFTADAATQSCITDEQAQYFLDNGFLVIRSVIRGEELKLIQREMMGLVEKGAAGVKGDPDFMYGKGLKSGNDVLRRVEYVIDKSDPMKALLGNPFILRSVEKLQGRNFIPTWDSMVLKMPDEGIVVPWHRDGKIDERCTDPRPIFNVDFYLDEADLKSCLWIIPGSNHWPQEKVDSRVRNKAEFDTSDAIPVPMQPGDVIFHDIKVLHGSPSGDGNALRRTVYYEFRAGEIEWEFGPHSHEYLKLKQQLLLECLKRRAQAPYVQGEEAFTYSPDGWFAIQETVPPTQFRYAHGDYRRE